MSIVTTIEASANAKNWADGSWGWIPEGENKQNLEKLSCNADSLTVKLDLENNRYIAHQQDGAPILGDILFIDDSFITIRYDNEERLMDDGKPHIWSLYFIDANKFVWVRQDWIKDGRVSGATSPIQRCVLPLA